jgi:tetratricopeptide (TPR) repeat protein
MWALAVLKAAGPPPPIAGQPVEGLEKVERVLKRALELHPNSIELAVKVAENLSRQGRYEEAERRWIALQARHPESPTPYAGLASHSASMGRHDESRDFAEEALKRNPDPTTMEHLASALLYVPGERKRAIELLERAVKVTKNPATHVLIALLVETEDSSFAQAHLAAAARQFPRGSTRLDEEIARTKAVLATYPPVDS